MTTSHDSTALPERDPHPEFSQQETPALLLLPRIGDSTDTLDHLRKDGIMEAVLATIVDQNDQPIARLVATLAENEFSIEIDVEKSRKKVAKEVLGLLEDATFSLHIDGALYVTTNLERLVSCLQGGYVRIIRDEQEIEKAHSMKATSRQGEERVPIENFVSFLPVPTEKD